MGRELDKIKFRGKTGASFTLKKVGYLIVWKHGEKILIRKHKNDKFLMIHKNKPTIKKSIGESIPIYV